MNPWLGLASYTEESLQENHPFYGRNRAIATLLRLIENNLVVTMYGRSGIGKSSLLQAGVFPALKDREFYPLIVRFNSSDIKDTLSETLWETIIEKLKSAGIEYKSVGKPYVPDYNDVLVLRKLFASGRFTRKKDEEITPVVVFDQFEETLYNLPEKSTLLLQQLYALINDNVDFSISNPDWPDATNFRIVFSIREDDLFLLEDFIETLNLEDFKENRFRLLPLSKVEALEIILGPDPTLFKEDEKDAIADEIIALASTGVNGQINTLMLSLLCFLLYEGANGKKITLEDVKKHRENLLESYYIKSMEGIPQSQRKYLEDNLIDDQGRRNYIYLSDLRENAPATEKFLTENRNRILNLNQDKVEFIHDQLAASVSKLRNTRNKRYLRTIGTWVIGAILLALLAISFSVIPDPAYKSVLNNPEVWNVVNNNKVEHITIPKEIGDNIIAIYDCPNLRSITVDTKFINLWINNCPSLLKINVPKGFSSKINYDNCPRLQKENFLDSVKFDIFYKTYLTFEKAQEEGLVDYDKINNKLSFYVAPYVVAYHNSKWVENPWYSQDKIILEFPDSLKEVTSLYVPYGYKNQFLGIEDFIGFKEIKELPVYITWEKKVNGVITYFKVNNWVYWICIGVLFLLIIFIPKFAFFTALSWMAFYWFSYDILFPHKQAIAIGFGCGGAIIVLLIIYNTWIFPYFQKGGKKRLAHDWAKVRRFYRLFSFSKNKRYIISALILVGIGVGSYFLFMNYQRHKYHDLYFIRNVENLIKQEKYPLAYQLLLAERENLIGKQRNTADSLMLELLYNRNIPTKIINLDGKYVSSDGSMIFGKDEDQTYIIDVMSNERILLDSIFDRNPSLLAFNKDNSLIAFSIYTKGIILMNLKTGNVRNISNEYNGNIGFSDLSNILFYSDNQKKKFHIYNIDTGEEDEYDNFNTSRYYDNYQIFPLENDRLFAFRSDDDSIGIYDPYFKNLDESNGRIVKKFGVKRYPRISSLSADKKLIITDSEVINLNSDEVVPFEKNFGMISNGVKDYYLKFDKDTQTLLIYDDKDLLKGIKYPHYSLSQKYLFLDKSGDYLIDTYDNPIKIYYLGDDPKDKFSYYTLTPEDMEWLK